MKKEILIPIVAAAIAIPTIIGTIIYVKTKNSKQSNSYEENKVETINLEDSPKEEFSISPEES